jgi:hypothetical protein
MVLIWSWEALLGPRCRTGRCVFRGVNTRPCSKGTTGYGDDPARGNADCGGMTHWLDLGIVFLGFFVLSRCKAACRSRSISASSHTCPSRY